MPYLTSKESQQVILNIYVQPKSSRTGITGLHNGEIRLTITAPPVDGKANIQVTAFIARLFKLPKSAVTLLSGHQGRHKKVRVDGIAQDQVQQILTPLL